MDQKQEDNKQEEKENKKNEVDELEALKKELEGELSAEEMAHFEKVVSFLSKDGMKSSFGRKILNFIFSFLRKLAAYYVIYLCFMGIFRSHLYFESALLFFLFPLGIGFVLAMLKSILNVTVKNPATSIEIYAIACIAIAVGLDITQTYISAVSVSHALVYVIMVLAEAFNSVLNYYILKYRIRLMK